MKNSLINDQNVFFGTAVHYITKGSIPDSAVAELQKMKVGKRAAWYRRFVKYVLLHDKQPSKGKAQYLKLQLTKDIEVNPSLYDLAFMDAYGKALRSGKLRVTSNPGK